MRKRVARKIYFPKDVGSVYRETTLDRAFHRLRLGDRGKWVRLKDYLSVSELTQATRLLARMRAAQ